MVSSQGIEVTVAVDGQNLQEYGDDAEETVPNTVTKYIEAASGAHFSVKYGHTQDFLKQHEIEGVIYKIKIDGITMRRPVLDGTNHSGEVHGKYSQVRGVDMFQGFRFSDIKIDENTDMRSSDLQSLSQSVMNLGKIEVTVERLKKVGKPIKKGSSWIDKESIDVTDKSIPEKALKGQALSHRLSLSPMTPTKLPNILDVEYLDDQPFSNFLFKYRSRNALQALCIIPRSPSPVALEQRPPEELSREELLDIVRRGQDSTKITKTEVRAEQHRGIKREADPEVDEILASARATKAPRLNQVTEVIDLSDD